MATISDPKFDATFSRRIAIWSIIPQVSSFRLTEFWGAARFAQTGGEDNILRLVEAFILLPLLSGLKA
jgi:hypothetical protein